jgi:hypothetical protein
LWLKVVKKGQKRSKGAGNMGKRMLAMVAFALALTVMGNLTGMAQSHPVEGAYDVTASSSDLGELKFQIILKLDNGKWKGEIKDAAMPLSVTEVVVDPANKVKITSDAGGTSVIIAGSYEAGKITGQWTAGDMKGNMIATQKVAAGSVAAAPAAAPAPAVSAGVTSGIEGSYDTTIVADGQGEFTLGLVIKKSGDKLVTEVPVAGDLNIVEIQVKDPDVVNLTATYQGQGPIPLTGKRISADEMGGKWEAGGFSGTWKAKRKK